MKLRFGFRIPLLLTLLKQMELVLFQLASFRLRLVPEAKLTKAANQTLRRWI